MIQKETLEIVWQAVQRIAEGEVQPTQELYFYLADLIGEAARLWSEVQDQPRACELIARVIKAAYLTGACEDRDRWTLKIQQERICLGTGEITEVERGE